MRIILPKINLQFLILLLFSLFVFNSIAFCMGLGKKPKLPTPKLQVICVNKCDNDVCAQIDGYRYVYSNNGYE